MKSALSWSQICRDPALRDLPFKVELTPRGILEMSPSRPRHGEYQFKIGLLLSSLLTGGRVITECPIAVAGGVRVPDVVWLRQGREQLTADETALTVAPEICVEVLSFHNTDDEMAAKRRLYASVGCEEFWTCSEAGQMRFWRARDGVSLERSELCPAFPSLVEL